jgi:glycosyltransferase involved in cell wall biosynthesis
MIFLAFRCIFIRGEGRNIFYTSLSVGLFGILKTWLLVLIFHCKKYEVIIHVHRGDVYSKYLGSVSIYKYFLEHILSLSDIVIVLSEYQVDEINKIKECNVVTLHNTIEFEIPRKKYVNFVKEFIYLSNIIVEKGYRDLYFAFSSVELNGLKLQFVGAVSSKNDKKFIDSHNVNANIDFSDPIYGLKKLYHIRSKDVFVLPSYNEGQPISILESMSMGVIIIATDVGCVRDMLPDGYPYIIPPRDSHALCEAISEVSQLAPNVLSELSQQLSDKYFSDFSKDNFKSNVRNIFKV